MWVTSHPPLSNTAQFFLPVLCGTRCCKAVTGFEEDLAEGHVGHDSCLSVIRALIRAIKGIGARLKKLGKNSSTVIPIDTQVNLKLGKAKSRSCRTSFQPTHYSQGVTPPHDPHQKPMTHTSHRTFLLPRNTFPSFFAPARHAPKEPVLHARLRPHHRSPVATALVTSRVACRTVARFGASMRRGRAAESARHTAKTRLSLVFTQKASRCRRVVKTQRFHAVYQEERWCAHLRGGLSLTRGETAG